MKIFVKPGEEQKVSCTFNYIYCQSANGQFSINLKDGAEISFGVNCYYRHPEEIQSFYIKNPNDFELELEIVTCYGVYGDNSTVISQDVTVIDRAYSLKSIEEKTIGDDGELELDATGARLTRVQNISDNEMRLYSLSGFKLYPAGTEELTLSGVFKIYGTSGDKIIFGVFK